MADPQGVLDFMQRGVRMLLDMGCELGGIELAPAAPGGFRSQRVCFGGGEVTVDRTLAQREPPGSFGTGAARLDKFHHPFPQILRVCFHPSTLPPILPM